MSTTTIPNCPRCGAKGRLNFIHYFGFVLEPYYYKCDKCNYETDRMSETPEEACEQVKKDAIDMMKNAPKTMRDEAIIHNFEEFRKFWNKNLPHNIRDLRKEYTWAKDGLPLGELDNLVGGVGLPFKITWDGQHFGYLPLEEKQSTPDYSDWTVIHDPEMYKNMFKCFDFGNYCRLKVHLHSGKIYDNIVEENGSPFLMKWDDGKFLYAKMHDKEPSMRAHKKTSGTINTYKEYAELFGGPSTGLEKIYNKIVEMLGQKFDYIHIKEFLHGFTYKFYPPSSGDWVITSDGVQIQYHINRGKTEEFPKEWRVRIYFQHITLRWRPKQDHYTCYCRADKYGEAVSEAVAQYNRVHKEKILSVVVEQL